MKNLTSARLSNTLTPESIKLAVANLPQSSSFIRFFLYFVACILDCKYVGKNSLLKQFNNAWKSSLFVDSDKYQSFIFELYASNGVRVTKLTKIERAELATLSALSLPYGLKFKFENENLIMQVIK